MTTPASAPVIERVRAALAGQRGITEKPMFGGICFLLRGNMLCGTGQGRLMFRVGKDNAAAARGLPGATVMVHGGRVYPGYFRADPAACDEAALRRWLALAVGYVGQLPEKAAGGSKAKTAAGQRRGVGKGSAPIASKARRR